LIRKSFCEENISRVIDVLGKGCRKYVAAYPRGASQQKHLKDEKIFDGIEGLLLAKPPME